MRRAAVGAVLAALAVLPAAAIPPEFPGGSALPMAGPTPPGAKAIIDQLGSDDYRAREKAGKSILALGDRALPALKAALASTDDPEVHRRIEVLVEQLETERLVSPRRVTLKVKDKSVADIVAELAKQSGYPLQYQDGRDGVQKLSFDLADVPFFRALGIRDFKMDLASVAALLTLVGYSVNDTIVVFDRIREVRGKNPLLTPQMINDSVNQTLTRTILSSTTVMVVVLVLYLLGGPVLRLFAFVMIVGVVVGTYSSIYIASPLLLIFGEGAQANAQRARETAEVRS